MEQWYVIQVRTGKEQWVVKACDLLIDEPCLSKSFIPFSKRLRKYRGEWVERTEILFPGYVFMISDESDTAVSGIKEDTGSDKDAWKEQTRDLSPARR